MIGRSNFERLNINYAPDDTSVGGGNDEPQRPYASEGVTAVLRDYDFDTMAALLDAVERKQISVEEASGQQREARLKQIDDELDLAQLEMTVLRPVQQFKLQLAGTLTHHESAFADIRSFTDHHFKVLITIISEEVKRISGVKLKGLWPILDYVRALLERELDLVKSDPDSYFNGMTITDELRAEIDAIPDEIDLGPSGKIVLGRTEKSANRDGLKKAIDAIGGPAHYRAVKAKVFFVKEQKPGLIRYQQLVDAHQFLTLINLTETKVYQEVFAEIVRMESKLPEWRAEEDAKRRK